MGGGGGGRRLGALRIFPLLPGGGSKNFHSAEGVDQSSLLFFKVLIQWGPLCTVVVQYSIQQIKARSDYVYGNKK